MTMRAGRRERKWRWFVAWMLPGMCFAFVVTAVGVFMVPVGLALVVWLFGRRPGVDAFGLLAGIGTVVVWIGSINLNYHACSSGPASLSLPASGAARFVSYSCGGVNGVPWMIVGACAVIAAVVLYLVATRSAPPAGPDPFVGRPLAG
jgi:hypothetical protein